MLERVVRPNEGLEKADVNDRVAIIANNFIIIVGVCCSVENYVRCELMMGYDVRYELIYDMACVTSCMDMMRDA